MQRRLQLNLARHHQHGLLLRLWLGLQVRAHRTHQHQQVVAVAVLMKRKRFLGQAAQRFRYLFKTGAAEVAGAVCRKM